MTVDAQIRPEYSALAGGPVARPTSLTMFACATLAGRRAGNRTSEWSASMADVEHLRELLDAAVAAFETAHAGLAELSIALGHGNNQERRKNTWITVNDGLTRVGVELHRLELRFPLEHRIVTSYGRVHSRLYDRLQPMFGFEAKQVLTSSQGQEVKDHAQKTLDALRDFATAAREEIGVANTLARASD
jgi:hypothetical protein